MMSRMVVLQTCLFTIMSVVNTCRGILGSIESNVIYWIWIIANYFRDLDGGLTLTEYFGIKFYTLVIRKRVLSINDDFGAMFQMLANKVVTALGVVTLSFTQHGYDDEAWMVGRSSDFALTSPLGNG